jgi:hypothetical protein
VVERLKGGAGTDFGAPGEAPPSDDRPFAEADLRRYRPLLKACWRAFDAAAEAAAGKELRKGPRGGGRDLQAISRHVLEGEAAYMGQIAWKLKVDPAAGLAEEHARARAQVLEALEHALQHGIPKRGPRGGLRWTAHYFVRRSTWHVLDHAWEIEDRIS